MKVGRSLRKTWLVWFGSLFAVVAVAATLTTELTPNIPSPFNPNESLFQNFTHFLVFEGSDTAGENAQTSSAYYNAIDPSSSKREFTQWLTNAGFISNASEWNPTGPQKFACALPGCDYPPGTHGYGIINTDSHVIVLNAADLGFVRNQFVRCVPSCTSPNPTIYTYLENYPVNPFSASGNPAPNNSGFPILTGYPSQAEATAAINSAIQRPLGTLANCDPTKTDTALRCSIQRIADVAFEWAPPPPPTSSSTKYGQLYAFFFDSKSQPGVIRESIGIHTGSDLLPTSTSVLPTPDLATGGFTNTIAEQPFPPSLDFIGFKEHPGNCFICHGGKPQNLINNNTTYPNQGLINGFRFLPLDVRNLLFTSDGGPEPTSRVNQELQMKVYNQAVLLTVNQTPERDDEGILRSPHLAEVIKGWYAASATDQNMTGKIQNGYWQNTFHRDFVPQNWIDADHGGPAPNGSEDLYEHFLAPACRSCHFNRELSTDFGTAANFNAHGSDLLNYVLLPLCKQPVDKGFRPMPLAHLTYQRLWQTNHATQYLLSGQGGPLTLTNLPDELANYFHYAGTAGYCNSSN